MRGGVSVKGGPAECAGPGSGCCSSPGGAAGSGVTGAGRIGQRNWASPLSVLSQSWVKQKASLFPLNMLFIHWDFHIAIPAERNTDQMPEILKFDPSRCPGKM